MRILLDIKRADLEDKTDGWSRLKLLFLKLYMWIADQIYSYIMYPIKRFARGIKNIFIWMPTIYSDIQWDYNAIYKILYKKLTLMEKFFRSPKAMTMDSEKHADEIHECIEILERLIEDDYAKDAYEAYHAKWGESKFIFTDVEDKPGYQKLHIVYPNVKTEEDEIERRKEFTEVTKAEADEHKQDVADLFNKIGEKIEYWWD